MIKVPDVQIELEFRIDTVQILNQAMLTTAWLSLNGRKNGFQNDKKKVPYSLCYCFLLLPILLWKERKIDTMFYLFILVSNVLLSTQHKVM